MKCKHPDCQRPLSFLYHNGQYGLIFIRRGPCMRQYRAKIISLRLLPESPNQSQGSDHDCRESLVHYGYTDNGEIRLLCEKCSKIFTPEQVRYEHFVSLAFCEEALATS